LASFSVFSGLKASTFAVPKPHYLSNLNCVLVFRQLREGSLEENQLVDGSRLTLLPSVETGLLVSIFFICSFHFDFVLLARGKRLSQNAAVISPFEKCPDRATEMEAVGAAPQQQQKS
jgi:hypothetical protein